jgi:hypothetical protein
MVERYWRTVRGALFLEFPLVRKSAVGRPRYLDALIVTDWRSSLSSCRQSTSTWTRVTGSGSAPCKPRRRGSPPYGFDGGHLFTDNRLRVLAEDTPGSRERDRETVEAWYRS